MNWRHLRIIKRKLNRKSIYATIDLTVIKQRNIMNAKELHEMHKNIKIKKLTNEQC